VSGYLWTGIAGESYDSSHAWAEAFVSELGWVGFDAAHRVCPTENYIRVAVGLDFSAAAPVRARCRGLAEQSLSVEVEIRRQGGDQQGYFRKPRIALTRLRRRAHKGVS
jgi:transglutaminase-like putative cysteine protease